MQAGRPAMSTADKQVTAVRSREARRLPEQAAGAQDGDNLLRQPKPHSRTFVDVNDDEKLADESVRRATAHLADWFADAGQRVETSHLDTDEKTWAPFGPAPLRQVRRVFVAKFNAASADEGRFAYSDPYVVDELWWDLPIPDMWVSDQKGHSRTTSAHQTIQAGDLIFVYRSRSSRDPSLSSNKGDAFKGRPTLLGVWWVTHTRRRYLPGTTNRPVTDVYHVPLVKFTEPVDVKTIRRHPALADIRPFKEQNTALVSATPEEAAALVAACSLPSYVLTNPDPVEVSLRLRNVKTGMRPGDLRYRTSSTAKYEYIHEIETTASLRVQRELNDAGWEVEKDMQRCPGWGADLLLQYETDTTRKLHVEVKGKNTKSFNTVVLQKSQYKRAHQSAALNDGVWLLMVCLDVLKKSPPPTIEKSAQWVVDNWPRDRVK